MWKGSKKINQELQSVVELGGYGAIAPPYNLKENCTKTQS